MGAVEALWGRIQRTVDGRAGGARLGEAGGREAADGAAPAAGDPSLAAHVAERAGRRGSQRGFRAGCCP